MSVKKILAIDDERDLCRIIKRYLESTGEYEVSTAFSGEEGVEKFKASRFDLVITDFKLPGMDGGAVLEAVLEIEPETPVILFSIYNDDCSTVTSGVVARAAGIVRKPFHYEQLLNAVEKALRPREEGGQDSGGEGGE